MRGDDVTIWDTREMLQICHFMGWFKWGGVQQRVTGHTPWKSFFVSGNAAPPMEDCHKLLGPQNNGSPPFSQPAILRQSHLLWPERFAKIFLGFPKVNFPVYGKGILRLLNYGGQPVRFRPSRGLPRLENMHNRYQNTAGICISTTFPEPASIGGGGNHGGLNFAALFFMYRLGMDHFHLYNILLTQRPFGEAIQAQFTSRLSFHWKPLKNVMISKSKAILK